MKFTPRLPLLIATGALASALLLATSLSAQNTWTGANSALWNDTGNWSLNAVPVTQQDLVFDETGQVTTVINDLGSPFETGGILFGEDAPAYTLQGDTIRIRDTIRNESAFLQTLDLGVIIRMGYPDAATPTIDTGAAGIVLNGALTSHSTNADHNPDRLAKVGSGTLYLNSNDNAFRGREAFIFEGDIQLGASHAMGNVAWAVNISDGATLTFASGATDDTFYIPGLTMAAGSSLVLEDTDGNPIHLVLNRQVNRSSGLRSISGSGSLTIDTHVDASQTVQQDQLSHTGGTFILSGTLAVNTPGNPDGLGPSDIEIHGDGNLRLGLSTLTVTNDVFLNGGTISRSVHQNHALNFGTSGQVVSIVTGGITTEVKVLAGTNNGDVSGNIETLYSFVGSPSAAASNDTRRLSDIFTIDNPGVARTFVLQLSTESLNTASYLGIFNPVTEMWIEAVDSNLLMGPPASLAGFYEMSWDEFLAENGSFDATSMLGAHGYDADNNAVWAVLNYGANEVWDTDFGGENELDTANFAIVAVPEPATVAAILGALALGLAFWRRRR